MTPQEGRGAPRGEPVAGDTGGGHGPREPVNETAPDSRTGKEEAGTSPGAILDQRMTDGVLRHVNNEALP